MESTRKLLEKGGTPRTSEFFVHKTCPDEESEMQRSSQSKLHKSFEKVRYNISDFNLNSPVAQ